MTSRKLASTAVMARRHEPADSLDYFPTPPWATRAFCEHVLPLFETPDPDVGIYGLTAIDPACGEGHMAVALREYFSLVTATDIFPYGFGGLGDFLDPNQIYAPRDWVITNPPFNQSAAFIERAFDIANRGVAMLVRTAFLEGQGRYRDLFRSDPPQLVAQFVERVPMHKGRWDPAGKTATAYCWVVWQQNPQPGREHTRFTWIPPCRKELTRPDDAIRFNAAAAVPLLEAAVP